MEIENWHRKYKDRLIERGGLTEVQAEETLRAAIGSDMIDYEDDPEDCADDEMSYWN